MAHPLGANFYELVGIFNYQYKRFLTECKLNLIKIGVDRYGSHYGSNVFLPYYDATTITSSEVGQGIDANIIHLNLSINYIINPANKLRAFVSLHKRNYQQDIENKNTNIIMFGIRTNLCNQYFDF